MLAVFVVPSGACGGGDDDAALPTTAAGSTTTNVMSGTSARASQPDGAVTIDEASEGIIHVGSGATGVSKVTVDAGVARVYLEGGCSSGGSTLTVASEILPTVM